MTHLPLHPHLTHPLTGDRLRAIHRTKAGRLVWPVMGGAPDPDPNPAPPNPNPNPPNPTDPPADPANDGIPAGDKRKILAELAGERDKRQALEAKLEKLGPLEKLAEMLGADKGSGKDGKTDIDRLNERFTQQEQMLADERKARWRAEVQADEKLTPEQAAWLTGDTKEAMAENAKKLRAAFGAKPDDGTNPNPRGRTPRPDPAQGAGGTPPAGGREAGLAEARKRFPQKNGTAT